MIRKQVDRQKIRAQIVASASVLKRLDVSVVALFTGHPFKKVAREKERFENYLPILRHQIEENYQFNLAIH